MYFANRGLSSFWVIGLVLMAVILFINIIPPLLIIGAGVWSVTYIVKKIKNRYFKSSSDSKDGSSDDVTDINTNFSNANVIDVDYTEIK